jgi:hypothetical protein
MHNRAGQIVNGKKLNTSYAIVQLQDYNQAQVRYNASDYVYYGYVNLRARTGRIPAFGGGNALPALPLIRDTFVSVKGALCCD